MTNTPTKVPSTHKGYNEADDLNAFDDINSLEDVENVELFSRANTSDFGFGSTMLDNLEKQLPGTDVLLDFEKANYLLLPETCEPEIVNEVESSQKQIYNLFFHEQPDKEDTTNCEKVTIEQFDKQGFTPFKALSSRVPHSLQANVLQFAPDSEEKAQDACLPNEQPRAISPPFEEENLASLEEKPNLQAQSEHYSPFPSSKNSSESSTSLASSENDAKMAVKSMAVTTTEVVTTAISPTTVSNSIPSADIQTLFHRSNTDDKNILEHSTLGATSIGEPSAGTRMEERSWSRIRGLNSSYQDLQSSKTFPSVAHISPFKRHQKDALAKQKLRRAVRKVMSTKEEQRTTIGAGKRGPKQRTQTVPSGACNAQQSSKALQSTTNKPLKMPTRTFTTFHIPQHYTLDRSEASVQPVRTEHMPTAIQLAIRNGGVRKSRSTKDGKRKNPSTAHLPPKTSKQLPSNCSKIFKNGSQTRKIQLGSDLENSAKTLRTGKKNFKKRFEELQCMVRQVEQEAWAYAERGAGKGVTKVLDAVNESLETIEACKESCLQACADGPNVGEIDLEMRRP